MVASSGQVLQYDRWPIVDCDKNINRAVIIEITESQSPRGKHLVENRTGIGTNVLQTFAVVVEEQKRLLVGYLGGVLLDSVIRVAISNEQINHSVVIVIEKLYTPAAHEPCGGTDA